MFLYKKILKKFHRNDLCTTPVERYQIIITHLIKVALLSSKSGCIVNSQCMFYYTRT